MLAVHYVDRRRRAGSSSIKPSLSLEDSVHNYECFVSIASGGRRLRSFPALGARHFSGWKAFGDWLSPLLIVAVAWQTALCCRIPLYIGANIIVFAQIWSIFWFQWFFPCLSGQILKRVGRTGRLSQQMTWVPRHGSQEREYLLHRLFLTVHPFLSRAFSPFDCLLHRNPPPTPLLLILIWVIQR